MARVFFFCLFQFVLTFVTSAQSQGTRTISDINDMVSRSEHCEMALLGSAEFAPISPKLNSMDMPSMALLADDTKPTNSEIKLLIEFYDRRQPCMQRMIEDAGHIHPAMVFFLAQSYKSAADTYLQLVKGQLTWGQYAEIKRARVLRTQQNFSQVVQDIQGKSADTNAYVIQQRQSASDALTAWGAYQLQLLTQQNLINPINQTHMTQCRYVGATLQCYTM